MKNLAKILLLVMILIAPLRLLSQNYDVGVFYMPFWEYSTGGDPLAGNWGMINSYDSLLVNMGQSSKVRIPDNIYWPSPVWYDETRQSVNEKQLEIMSTYGIDFAIYDSFYSYYGNGSFGPYYYKPIENLIKPGFNNYGVKFALMWADQFMPLVKLDGTDASCDKFFNGGGLIHMANYWKQFVTHSNYKKIDDKPVFYILYPATQGAAGANHTNSIEGICGECKDNSFFSSLGADINEPYINHKKTKYLLEQIEAIMGVDLYYVAVIEPQTRPESLVGNPSADWDIKWDWLKKHPELAGYNALTTYRYKFFDREDEFNTFNSTVCTGATTNRNLNYNYAKMQSVYKEYYNYIINNSTIDYQVPVNVGYNQAPITYYNFRKGVPQPTAGPCNLYNVWPPDNAESTPNEFEQSLYDAKAVADANPTKTKKIITICCWNEYAEGSVIEPTYAMGSQYLQKVKSVLELNAPKPPWIMSTGSMALNLTPPEQSNPGQIMMNIYPNPADEILMISYYVPESGIVKMQVYDVNGQLIKELVNGKIDNGKYNIQWNVSHLIPGLYLISVSSNGRSVVRQVIVQ